MTLIRFGENKRYKLVLNLIAISIVDLKLRSGRMLRFISISKYIFAICRPIWIEGIGIEWVIGWRYYPKGNILTEFHLWNKTWTIYRKLKKQLL